MYLSSLCSLSRSKYHLPHCLWPLAFGLRSPSVVQHIWARYTRYLDQNTTYDTAFGFRPQASQCGSPYLSSLRSLFRSKHNSRPGQSGLVLGLFGVLMTNWSPEPRLSQEYAWMSLVESPHYLRPSASGLSVWLIFELALPKAIRAQNGHHCEKLWRCSTAFILAPFWLKASFCPNGYFLFLGIKWAPLKKFWVLCIHPHWKRAAHAKYGKDRSNS